MLKDQHITGQKHSHKSAFPMESLVMIITINSKYEKYEPLNNVSLKV